MTTLIWTGLCDLIILGCLYFLGALVLRLIFGRVDWLAAISLSFGLGSGLFTWVIFILSWTGIALTKGTVTGLYIGIVAVLALLAWRIPLRTGEQTPTVKTDGRIAAWTHKGLWIVIVLMIGASAFLAVGLSYFGWDDIARWTVKGYGIALQGSVFAAANWGGVDVSYPLNIPILISIFRILDGDLLPGSKLMYPIFYASMLIGCYRFWLLQGLRRWTASLGALLLACTPIIFTHAFLGYANLPFTFYLVSGLLWSIAGIQAGSNVKMLVGGFLLAIAVWTRPEGLSMLLLSIIALEIAQLLTKSGKIKIIPLLLPAMILIVPWLVFQKLHATLNAEVYQYSGLALKGLLAGDIRWADLYTIIRFIVGQIIRFKDWGFTMIVPALLLAADLRLSGLRRDYSRAVLFLLSILLSVVVFWSAFIAAYAPGGSEFLYEWISTTLMRSFMPVAFCLTLLGFLSLKELQ
jgi:hypothetical protein